MPGPTHVPSELSRRTLLQGAALTATAVAGTSFGGARAWAAPPNGGPVRQPFTLGVASGDPEPDGVVLWTRLAPEPLAPDGRSGMPDRVVPVQWQVATDERFSAVVAEGTELARPELGHSVHPEVRGLRPGADYFYRFKAGPELSPVGRTRTAAGRATRVDRFSFAFTSCQDWASGLYTAHRRMSEEDLDLVVQLGDYIYEGAPNPNAFRRHEGDSEPVTLAEYRARHAQYKTDADLQAAHAAFPWVVVLDDHELDNNWADEVPQDPTNQPPAVFLARRAAAFQAYYENMPLRRSSVPRGIDLQLYRRLAFGDLLDLHVLDTRQYRSDQDQARRLDPTRTILGGQQRAWLDGALAGPTARWNVLAQQVFFSQRDFTAGPVDSFSDDAWDNYVVERDGLRDHLVRGRDEQPGRAHGRRPRQLRVRREGRLRGPGVGDRRDRARRHLHHDRRQRPRPEPDGRRAARREPAHPVSQPQPRLRPQHRHRDRVDGRLPSGGPGDDPRRTGADARHVRGRGRPAGRRPGVRLRPSGPSGR